MWIIANWKSNKNIAEALDWVGKVGPDLERKENLKVVVCPNYTDIEEVKKAILVGNYPMLVGAQDLSAFDNGPYTGEESARILKELVDLVILGHSERRENCSETDQIVEEKVKRALEHDIIPLVCVQNKETPVPENVKLVAFEPVFAIGTGNPDNSEDASKVAESFKEKYGPASAGLEVLYGGSVDSQNAKAFLQQENISGLLIGTSSLDPQEFIKIVEVAYQFI
ncbi:MAG: triose-phosphate isomerase family protein [Candidatus Daviesbacteria bacterium]|nr:triose-phosphate isomerase family protein [Candidatus Daviesbacteria bacterium]